VDRLTELVEKWRRTAKETYGSTMTYTIWLQCARELEAAIAAELSDAKKRETQPVMPSAREFAKQLFYEHGELIVELDTAIALITARDSALRALGMRDAADSVPPLYKDIKAAILSLSPGQKALDDYVAEVVTQALGGEWCGSCNKPQYVLPNGEHDCATIEELRNSVADQIKAAVLAEAEKIEQLFDEQYCKHDDPLIGIIRTRKAIGAHVAVLRSSGEAGEEKK
jgi:hypothetical protein